MRGILFSLVLFAIHCIVGATAFSKGLQALFPDYLTKVQNSFRADLLWCGINDNAPTYLSVSAIYPNLDQCCRQHDFCDTLIDRKTCVKGICNKDALFPILGCHCEENFKRCLENVSATAARSEADWSLGGGVSLSERLLSEAIQTGYFEVVPRIADRQCIVVRKASVAKNKRKYYCSRTDDKGECIRHTVIDETKETWSLVKLQDALKNRRRKGEEEEEATK